MAAKTLHEPAPTAFLEALKSLPFVRKVSFARDENDNARVDGLLTVLAGNKRFALDVVQKRSYLDRASLHALTALAALSKRPIILFARYIPRESGDQLIGAGVNFVDRAGNLHVLLDKRYAHTVLGRPQPEKPKAESRVTAAQVQMVFAYAAEPTLLARPVREIARHAGISKSKAAEIRQQLIEENQRQTPGVSSTARSRSVQERLLSGYAGVLRPKLLIGRFRAAETTADAFLERLRTTAAPTGVRFSLTGGPAADRLQHFYRGPEVPLFVDPGNPEARQRWRLLPDREGPIILLRAFGELVFWKTVNGLAVAHPWLIYAELMYSNDPRAHEAGEELRREYLSQ